MAQVSQPRMSAAQVAPPRDKSEIEVALQDLFAELDCLNSEILQLESKLAPVLGPQNTDKEPGYPMQAAGSMVMGQLREIRQILGSKRNMVKALTARAEL